jgi:hypothetical protein
MGPRNLVKRKVALMPIQTNLQAHSALAYRPPASQTGDFPGPRPTCAKACLQTLKTWTGLRLTAGPPVTRLGDLWLLGSHRVLCGNALDQAAYAGLMQDDRAQMVFVDPPYNVPIEGNVSGLGAIHHRAFMMASGEMNEAEFTSFLAEAFSLSSTPAP